MIEISYAPTFLRQLKALSLELQEEVVEKTALFEDPRNHKVLKVHKLKGRLSGRYSFSVNYRYRIVFCYLSKNEAVLLAIGDHDVYR